MTIVARMLTQEQDGIPGYMAHPAGPGTRPGVLMVHHAHGVTADYKIDAYRLATLGYNVLAPSLFNMFGIPGTTQIGHGADLQAKHSDGEFLGKMEEAWRYLTGPMKSDPARTACIGHCMGGRLLIPFAADHPQVRAIVLYYPSVRDEPETSHRPRHAFKLAPTLSCASLVFCGGKDYIATPAIQAPLWQAFCSTGSRWSGTTSPTPTTASATRTTRVSAALRGSGVAAGDGFPAAPRVTLRRRSALQAPVLHDREQRVLVLQGLMSSSGLPSTSSRSAR
jgi:carboxymethylenebutenolidase